MDMDIGSRWPILEVVEDNEEISNDSVPESSGVVTVSKVHVNRSRGEAGIDELFPEVRPEGADVTDPKNPPPPLDLKPETSPSTARKGKGLRKWKRIDRGARKMTGTGNMAVTHELPDSDVISSKRVQYAERYQKSEGSVSSTNAVVQIFDDVRLGLGGPPFAAVTESENSEDQSSKSSTAASAPKFKQEMPINSGRMGSLSGNNLRPGRVGSTKKSRGEQRVNIEKENSHSSLESDSRSSNFLFVQGTLSTGNGIGDERLKHSDGVQQASDGDGHRGVYDEGYEASLPPEGGGVADSSSEVKEERSENYGYSSDQGTPDESLFALQSVQEALEKELLQIQEIGKDISIDDSVSDAGVNFIINDEKEVEDLFKQKIEAEVKYMAISRTVQKLRVVAMDQITHLEEQKALATKQTQILNKLDVAEIGSETEKEAAVLKKEAEKLEDISGEIAGVDEIMKLQNRACRYGSCFLAQLVLLLAFLGFLMFNLSPTYVEVVPT